MDWDLNSLDYIPFCKKKTKRQTNRNLNSSKSYNLAIATDELKEFYVGKLLVGTTSNVLPEKFDNCEITYLTNSAGAEKDSIVLKCGSKNVIVELIDRTTVKSLVHCSILAFQLTLSDDENLYFDIFFKQLPLPKFNYKIALSIKSLFNEIFRIRNNLEDNVENTVDPSSAGEIDDFYKKIKQIRLAKNATLTYPASVQHPKLKPILRPYQRDAVRWMINREQCQSEENFLNPLYVPVTLASGLLVYYDKYNGNVEREKPTVKYLIRGGILADEMGLGKTVEVLACILLHSKQSNGIQNGVISDDDSSEDSSDDAKPQIDKISQKRKHTLKPKDDPPAKEKQQRKEEEFVKGGRNKSENFQLLTKWYNDTLRPFAANAPKQEATPSVQCICGSVSEENLVECTECEKIQHATCLGFEKRYGEYICPQCWTDQPLIECGATLIVTPLSLRAQWCDEICKHIKGNFKVLQYGGVSQTPIYPTKLLEYDVVITTYNVLQAEFRLTEVEKEMNFRHQRKYSPPGSPITRIMWWRLCLDEAQTVEAPTSMVSAMAQKLSAHFRWGVTGTPISKQIADLYGLVDYLQIDPYQDKFIWDKVLYEPYLRGDSQAIYKFFSEIMWRSSKLEIENQINIPKQTIREHWLSFSAIEQYFYKMEHEHNRDEFLSNIRREDPDKALETMNSHTLKKTLGPLVTLRQVCTYPNTIRTRYLSTKKAVSSMKELLEALIAKNIVECEEFLRIVLCSLNGLAGIYLLLESPEEAINQYREVLQLYTRFTAEEKKIKLSVDKLPIIHTMYNLAQVLEIYPNSTNKTLRDDRLRNDCKELEQQYLSRFINDTINANREWSAVCDNVEKMQSTFKMDDAQWYCEALNWIYLRGYETELHNKISNLHDGANIALPSHYENKQVLLHAITSWDAEISENREAATDIVKKLFKQSTVEENLTVVVDKELVESARDCHLRPDKKSKKSKKCKICLADLKLKHYEIRLFTISKRRGVEDEVSLQGSWKPKSEELVFRSIVGFIKLKNINEDIIHDGEMFVNILDTMKKEFKELRKLWTYIEQQVRVLDELDICKVRLQLASGSESEKKTERNQTLKNLSYVNDNKLDTINLIKERELEYQRTSLINEQHDFMARLEKNLGIRNYLQTLHRQYYEGQTPDPCPICKNNLEKHWSIIPCGHSFCMECIQLLLKQNCPSTKIQCSLCRVYYLIADISYIKQGAQKSEDETDDIKGNYSTKIEAVIKLIFDLKAQEENVKILIFSSWLSVLNYLEGALSNNNILYELINSASVRFEKQIESFKYSETMNVLLLPISLGGKGLNLIEATHVILIEPLLNRGEELQAVGRVHRIGQTKPTVVHKFYVKNTLEETIYKSTSENKQKWEKNKVTLRQLTDLFTEVAPPAEDQD